MPEKPCYGRVSSFLRCAVMYKTSTGTPRPKHACTPLNISAEVYHEVYDLSLRNHLRDYRSGRSTGQGGST